MGAEEAIGGEDVLIEPVPGHKTDEIFDVQFEYLPLIEIADGPDAGGDDGFFVYIGEARFCSGRILIESGRKSS